MLSKLSESVKSSAGSGLNPAPPTLFLSKRNSVADSNAEEDLKDHEAHSFDVQNFYNSIRQSVVEVMQVLDALKARLLEKTSLKILRKPAFFRTSDLHFFNKFSKKASLSQIFGNDKSCKAIKSSKNFAACLQ